MMSCTKKTRGASRAMTKRDDEIRSRRDKRMKNPEVFGMSFSEKEAYYKRKSRLRAKIKKIENNELTMNQIVKNLREISKEKDSDIVLKITLLKKGGGYIN